MEEIYSHPAFGFYQLEGWKETRRRHPHASNLPIFPPPRKEGICVHPNAISVAGDTPLLSFGCCRGNFLL